MRRLFTLLALTLVGVLTPAVALAADGVPLYPRGVDSMYSRASMTRADAGGQMLACEARYMGDSGPAVFDVPRILGWNVISGYNRGIGGEFPHLTITSEQQRPTVLDVSGTVYVAWQQRDAASEDWDLVLWKGDRQLNPAMGFPRIVVSGPVSTDQVNPDLGRVNMTGDGTHVFLAWEDDRRADGVFKVFAIDLSADADASGTPDYLEREPSADVGELSPGILTEQTDAAVGAGGIYWRDARLAPADADFCGAIWRAVPGVLTTPTAEFAWAPGRNRLKVQPHAIKGGAAWLGPSPIGNPYQIWAKTSGSASIVTYLTGAGVFDAVGSTYAAAANHAGVPAGDGDIYSYNPTVGQNVPVCSIGSSTGDVLKFQTWPTICDPADGKGLRVLWSDARHRSGVNLPSATLADLAWELRIAALPSVGISASRTTVHPGQRITFSTQVKPSFAGTKVRLQRGIKKVTHYAWGDKITYSSWTSIKTATLSSTSRATFTWTPWTKGTYRVRVSFPGGSKYKLIPGQSFALPHVPMPSRVLTVKVQ